MRLQIIILTAVISLFLGFTIGRSDTKIVYQLTPEQEKEFNKHLGRETHFMLKSIRLADALNECRGNSKYTPTEIN